jgi:pimeloyl-ACP methyl ester carboxylesterase
MQVEHVRIAPVGLSVGYVSRGEGPLVILVHGFPDTYRGFLPIMERLAQAGFRAVAPALRGYAPSGLAPDGDYRVEASAADVLGLADALGAERFSVVGHDWGAVTAYAVANLAPHRVERLVTAAVPHTGHFLLNIRLRQLIRSSYMLAFQLPWLPERRLARDDFAGIEALIRAWSPDWRVGEAQLRPLKDNYAQPGRLGAALAWYRQLPRSIASPLSRRLIFGQVAAPTRIIYGLRDGCIGAELFQHQQHRFRQPLDLVALTDAGHFMQWEQPELFARLVIEFLQAR